MRRKVSASVERKNEYDGGQALVVSEEDVRSEGSLPDVSRNEANNDLFLRYKQIKAQRDVGKLWQLALEEGNPYARYNMGVRSCIGYGTVQDVDYGKQLCTQAYRQFCELANDENNCDAMNWLGVCYRDGYGVEQSFSNAVSWFEKAAEAGSVDGQKHVNIWCKLHYNDIRPNLREAVKIYRLSAKQGNAEERLLLGICHAQGNGVAQDYNEAVRLFKQAADQGNAHAQCWLGELYYYGRGVEQDLNMAGKFFKQAADQGNAHAQCWLGGMYYYGRGVDKNYNSARVLLGKAVNQGNPGAQCLMGLMYWHGHGVKQNLEIATNLFRSAATKNYGYAKEVLAVIDNGRSQARGR
jgi:uncharacterized protein